MQKELEDARQAMAAGLGEEAQAQRLLEEQLQAEKEKRVLHLQQVGIRRMLKAGLARGWTSWAAHYSERVRQRRLLAAAANRLVRPRLVASYIRWRRDWEIYLAQRSKVASRSDIESELKRVRDEAERAKQELAEARQSMLAGRGQEAEMRRLMEEEIEAEREKRVANIQQIFVRRMMQQDLSRGWTAWHDKYTAKTHNARLLKQGLGRLIKPRLTKSFAHWHRDWDSTMLEKKRLSMMGQSQRELEQMKARLQELEDDSSRRLAQEAAKRARLEQELERNKELHEEEVALQNIALVEARKAATDALTRASAEKAAADQVRLAAEEVSAAEQRRQAEVERAAESEGRLAKNMDELQKLRSTTEEEIALQHVALVEARKAATDAISRVAVEQGASEAARKSADNMSAELARALAAAREAQSEAARSQNMLLDHKADSEEKLNRLLEEHREHLMREIVRITEDYERRLAEQRLMLARYGPPPELLSPKVHVKKTFRLTNDPNMSIAEQLRVQVRDEGLRVSELFNLLDTDLDGYINGLDWKVGIKKIGPDLRDKDIDDAFLQADIDGSNAIDLNELEEFIREALKPRKKVSPQKPPEAKPKKVEKPKGPDPKGMDKKQLNMLTALASSMGVRAEKQWYNEATSANIVGSGADDFQEMMTERAAAFGHADIDADGLLDFDEFCDMVRYRETTKYTEKQLRDKFNEVDLDGSGQVDLPEFIAYSLRDSLRRSKGRAIDLFRVWDEDNSGYIDKNEFGKAIISLGFVAGREDIAKVFDGLDEDGSGQIEYKELQQILKAPVKAVRPPSAEDKKKKTSVATKKK